MERSSLGCTIFLQALCGWSSMHYLHCTRRFRRWTAARAEGRELARALPPHTASSSALTRSETRRSQAEKVSSGGESLPRRAIISSESERVDFFCSRSRKLSMSPQTFTNSQIWLSSTRMFGSWGGYVRKSSTDLKLHNNASIFIHKTRPDINTPLEKIKKTPSCQ